MKTFFTTATIALLIVSAFTAQQVSAQQQRLDGQNNRGVQRAGANGAGGRGGGPGTQGSDGLAAAGLQVGQQLPDITVYDADGKPFRMADLKGKYSVIVFGCLT